MDDCGYATMKMHQHRTYLDTKMWIIVFLMTYFLHYSWATDLPPNMTEEMYFKDGDIIIGGLYSSRESSGDLSDLCGGKISRTRLQQNIEAMVYTLDRINKNDSILSNISLGYLILDDCRSSMAGLARAIQFTESIYDTCPSEVRKENSSVNRVVAVVGPTSSSRSIPVSQLMTMYRIPMFGPESTSDVLSDTFTHAYYFRLAQPDRYLAIAMTSMMEKFNWTYISLLYQTGSFGINLARNVEEQTRAAGICIAYSHEFPAFPPSDEYYDEIVRNLKKNSKARVVLLVFDVDIGPPLFRAVIRAGILNHFIWIGVDSFDRRSYGGSEIAAVGGFSLVVRLGRDAEFASDFENTSPWTSSGNPWLKPLWENVFDCSWTSTNSTKSCLNYPSISNDPAYSFSSWTSRSIDSIYTVAYALDKVVNNHCKSFIHNTTLLRCCITGRLLKKYVQDTSFHGLNGLIRFDPSGDLLGNYQIKQIISKNGTYDQVAIGYWESSTDEIIFTDSPQWYMESDDLKTNTEYQNSSIPRSVCSEPCGRGLIRIQGDVPCCWECRDCRRNEVVDANHTRCNRCPFLYWPDDDKYTCSKISPTYIRWTDIYGLVVIIVPGVGLAVSLIMSTIFVMKRDFKIVKASSPPLMTLVSIAVFLIFATAITFAAPPSNAACSYNHMGFHISCTLLYGTLCVKTTRIYRIFRASKKFRRPKTLIGDQSQVIVVLWLVFIQILVILGTVILGNYTEGYTTLPHILLPTRSSTLMPVETDKYVELACLRPRITLMPPLAFNMFLLLWCALAAFLTRHLPDAFNESWYIFLSVSATLVIWFAFLTSYFMMFYAYFREILLSLALSLNGFCNLLLLFSPKIYAIYFVNQDAIQTGVDFSSFGESRVNKSTMKSSQSKTATTDGGNAKPESTSTPNST